MTEFLPPYPPSLSRPRRQVSSIGKPLTVRGSTKVAAKDTDSDDGNQVEINKSYEDKDNENEV